MARIGVREGDPVEIIGKRHTVAIAVPPAPEDEGLTLARIDGLLRGNAGVAAGEQVEVRRPELRAARRMVFAPAQKDIRLHGPGEALRRSFLGRPFVAGDVVSTSIHAPRSQPDPRIPEELQRMLSLPAYGLQEIRLIVVSTEPRGVVQITPDTEVTLRETYEEPAESRRPGITYDDIGGLGDTVDRIRELVELPLRHPELFQRLGIDPPKGVLLHGPPGTGKTLLARVVASEAEASFFLVNGPEILGKMQGESEERLRQVFQQAAEKAPSIIFIDEIDSITPKRDQVAGEAERRLVAQLLTLMDGLQPRQNVMVIGATNRVESLDEALRRPGRFDRELILGVPDQAGRREILGIHTRGMPLDEDVDLGEIARITYGFVGADIAALAREAAMDAVRRILPEINLKEDVPAEVLDDLTVTRKDFDGALRRVQPSAMREIMIQVPDVTWDDIGGLDEVRRSMREGIELPLKSPDAFRHLGIRPAKGFLLYGPPGTGKTLLAKAVAREAEANFISTKSSDLLSKWYGESEQQIARLFRRARQVAPTVIFMDEIDSLVPVRGGGLGEPAVTERVVNTILAEMDGLEELQGVVVIAATNRPNLLDPALLRPGRFDELVYVPVPDLAARRAILAIRTGKMPLAHDVDLDGLAARTERYTGADLEDVARRAGLAALRDGRDEVAAEHFDRALGESRASVTPEMEDEYRQLRDSLGRANPLREAPGFRLVPQIAPAAKENEAARLLGTAKPAQA
jgi:transitional endoplasmic reticulum ATPase